MTDLSDFGAGLNRESRFATEQSATSTGDNDSSKTYQNGRCPALTTGDRRRCRAPVSRMKAADGFCGTHGRQHDPLSIRDDPEWLIRATGARTARCRALQRNGERCTSSCGPLEYFCGTHTDWPNGTVDELEPGELDVDRIREALQAVQDGGGC